MIDTIKYIQKGLSAFIKGKNCGSVAYLSIEQVRHSLSLLKKALESGNEAHVSVMRSRFVSSLDKVPASNMSPERSEWLAGAKVLWQAKLDGVQAPQPVPSLAPSLAPPIAPPVAAPSISVVQSSSDAVKTVTPIVLFGVIKQITPGVCSRRRPTLPLPRMVEIACAHVFRDSLAPCPEIELLRHQYAHFCEHGRLDVFYQSVPADLTVEEVTNELDSLDAERIELGTEVDLDAEQILADGVDADLDDELAELDAELDAELAELDAMDDDSEPEIETLVHEPALPTVPVPTVPVPTASVSTVPVPVPTVPVPTAPVPTAPVPTAPVPASPHVLPVGNDPATQRARAVMLKRQARQGQQQTAMETKAEQQARSERAAMERPGSSFV